MTALTAEPLMIRHPGRKRTVSRISDAGVGGGQRSKSHSSTEHTPVPVPALLLSPLRFYFLFYFEIPCLSGSLPVVVNYPIVLMCVLLGVFKAFVLVALCFL